jgi:tetratricopeptide (TPR) repeat protein
MKGEKQLWDILNDKLETLRASNRLPEAIRIAETALDLAKRAFIDDPASFAISYEKLGQLLDQTGDRATAKPYLLKAHELLEKVEPADQQALYRSARRLAFSCDNLGEVDEAIRYYEKAIAAASKLEELPYSDIGTMLNNIALILRKSGRQKSAEPYYLQALQIYEDHLGAEHADVASVLNNLGVFYTNERRFTEAERAHVRALGIRQRVHPAMHPDIAQSKCNLAVVYHSRGDYGRAAELYRDSLKTWEEATDTPPEDYEVVAANYADLLRSLGKARKAHALEARAKKKRRG